MVEAEMEVEGLRERDHLMRDMMGTEKGASIYDVHTEIRTPKWLTKGIYRVSLKGSLSLEYHGLVLPTAQPAL